MNLDLKGKTALVSGSTQGIGKATAIELSKMGANVILLARNEDKLNKVLQELEGDGTHAYIVGDFTNPLDLQAKVEAGIEEKDIHILVNNTGGPAGGPINEAKAEEFINAFNQHLICNHLLMQAVKPKMIAAGYGRIINIISTSVKQPLNNLGVSNTIRWAVAAWSKTLANELGQYNITVNNVLPGATDTARLQSIMENKANQVGATVEQVEAQMAAEVPMKRIAQANEVANAVAFLASPAASYINGINIPVDGGRTKSL